MASRSTCMVLLALLVVATYTATPSLAEPLLRGSSNNRKLAQWNSRYNNGYGSSGYRQQARNSASIVNTQYAINNAVESGAYLPATADAAYYGNDQAYLATQRYPYGWFRWGRR